MDSGIRSYGLYASADLVMGVSTASNLLDDATAAISSCWA